MKEMAAKRVMVEINFTSNDLILGLSGKQHPFSLYRKFGVPVALSTDDEGVSRIDLTHEFVRAVETYGLSYVDLKHLVRNSLEYSFLPGASLWASPHFTRLASACESAAAGGEKPSSACETFLKGSEKAEQQWELERRFGLRSGILDRRGLRPSTATFAPCCRKLRAKSGKGDRSTGVL